MPKTSQRIHIKNGRIIDPSQKIDRTGDLWIEDGKIIAPPKESTADTQVIDAQGLWILPGFIDVHVHFREPGETYKETILTGASAAVAGGFTSVACMANTSPVNDSPYVTAYIREKAKNAACRVFPIGAVSKGLAGEELAPIGSMVAEGAVAVSDDGMTVMNSYLMRKALDYAKAFGVAVISHAEDTNLVGQGVMNEGAVSNELGLRGNPAAAEEIIVARDIALCRLTGSRVHIAHLSSALALEHVRRAKAEGLSVTAEVTPHHLTLTEESLRTYDTCCKMRPPLRTAADVSALKKGLADGTIDMIATDHAPHGLIDKVVEFDQAANGIIGLQTATALTYELVRKKEITPSRWIDALTAKPAALINIPHGNLEVGREADVVLFNPEAEWEYTSAECRSKSHNSPFLNQKFHCRVEMTFVKGACVYDWKARMAHPR